MEVLDPKTHSLAPNLSDSRSVSNWRFFLFYQINQNRGWGCECCNVWGHLDTYDLHEGIVSRGDVQGWPFEKRGLIFHEYNCFVVCRECHTEHKLSREDAWKLSCERYGEEAVREWYEGLPWKVGVPRRFWNGD